MVYSYRWKDNGVPPFSEVIRAKMNVTVRLEVELVKFLVAIQQFSHHAMETPSGIGSNPSIVNIVSVF